MSNLVKKMNFDEISIEDSPPQEKIKSVIGEQNRLENNQEDLESIDCLDQNKNSLTDREKRRQDNLRKLELKESGRLPLYNTEFEPLPPPLQF